MLAACSAGAGPSPQRSASPAARSPSRSPAPAPSPTASPPLALQVTPAAYQLPSGISREVVLARGGNLLIIGGLNQRSVTTPAVTELNPVTGRTTRTGRLADASHDAAGALLGGTPYLFGGGVVASIATVQALRHGSTASVAGQLPGPRSDLSSVTLGTTAYLAGGYDGANYDAAVLATSNGSTFRTVATLPVPVRYAAVAGAGQDIWVFGGLTPAGPTRVIQRVNLATGKAAVTGHLPAPASGATAFTLGGRIFIAGGLAASGAASRAVLTYDPGRRSAVPAGTLPVPVSNAAAAVVGGTAFMVGGYDGHRQLPTVTQLRLVPAAAALPAVHSPPAAHSPPPPRHAHQRGTSTSAARLPARARLAIPWPVLLTRLVPRRPVPRRLAPPRARSSPAPRGWARRTARAISPRTRTRRCCRGTS